MITPSDSFYTYDLGKYYVILPSAPNWDMVKFKEEFNATKVEQGFSYNSGTNTEWETVESMRKLIREHVDNGFSYE